jgi:hypothetical protein
MPFQSGAGDLFRQSQAWLPKRNNRKLEPSYSAEILTFRIRPSFAACGNTPVSYQGIASAMPQIS